MLFDKQNRYSIRKLTIGAASVLIGVFWIGTTSNTAQAAKTSGAGSSEEQTGPQSTALNNNEKTLSLHGNESNSNEGISDSTNSGSAGSKAASEENTAVSARETKPKGTQTISTQNNSATTGSNSGQSDQKADSNSGSSTAVSAASSVSGSNAAQAGSGKKTGDQSVNQQTLNLGTTGSTSDVAGSKVKVKAKAKVKATSTNSNGGFDKSTWGTLDTTKWTGSVTNDGYYQLSGYTGDANHIIVPNEDDFEKAGEDTSGKQVSVSGDLMRTLSGKMTDADATIAFSKTDDKKVKAVGDDWHSAFSVQDNGGSGAVGKIDANNLDVSSVTNMNGMFEHSWGQANLSDLSGLSSWDTSNVTDMKNMFLQNNITDLSPLAGWNTSKVTSMHSMFNKNQDLSDISPLADWDTSKVTDMNGMFAYDRVSDVSSLSSWSISNADVSNMFLQENIEVPTTAGTRTINVTKPDGTTTTVTQTVNFNQPQQLTITIDKSKGSIPAGASRSVTNHGDPVVTTGSQNSTNGSYDAYTVPTIKGYTPSVSSVASEEAASGDNKTVNVTYTKMQDVTFEFVDDDNNGAIVGETHTQSMTPGVETNLDVTLTVPDHYTLASGQTIPTSYTLAANATAATTVKIHLNEEMYFKITLHDDTDNKDLYTQEVDNPQSGGYTALTIPAGTFPKGINAGNYTSVSATGVPEGVTFAGDHWGKLENANSAVWIYPNFKWTDDASRKALLGSNIVIHLKHNTTEVTTTEEANEASILHFVYGAGDQKGKRASDDAKVVFHYKRTKTATKDVVNGTESNVKYTDWVLDGYWNWGHGYDNGSDAVTPTNATVSDDKNTTTFDVPTIDGYTALTTGDWTTTAANVFDTSAANFHPASTAVYTLPDGQETGGRSYSAVPVSTQENTVYYVPTKKSDVRTVTEHYRYVDSNGNDAGQAEPDAQVNVYFKKNYSNGTFKTNGSTNSADWTWDATLDKDWSFDTSEGDASTPGFKVISGSWNITNGGTFSAPTGYSVDGYTENHIVNDGGKNYDAAIFAAPTNNPDTIFTTAATGQSSNQQTVYYIKNTDINSSVARVINVTKPGETTKTTKQPGVSKTRSQVVNKDDTGVKFGDWVVDSSNNQWADATSLAPNIDGYTIHITKSVDGGAATEGSTDDLKAVTVKADTKSEVINVTYTQDPTEEATETEGRTVTEHYIVAADGIVNGKFYKKGDKLFDDAVIEVYFKRNVTKDKDTGKVIKTGNWEWDPSQGDAETAGFKVISGKWNDIKGTKEKPKSGSWSVDIPSKDGFTAITDGVSNGFNTINLGYPGNGGSDYFTNDTDPTWYWRKTLTTYYIPSNIVRVINETAPDGTTTTTTQTSPFSGDVKLDNDDKGIVVSGATSGSWDAYTPKYSGYTIKVTKSVDGGEETTGSTDDLKAVTVTNDTKPEVINITYSATSKAELSGSASSTYTGSPITWDDVNNGINFTVTGPDSSTSGTYTLTQGDVQFTKDGTTTTSLPIDAGTYTISLTDAGKQNIEKKFGNKSIAWTDDSGQSTITGSATYTIKNKVAATVTVSGTQTETYDATAKSVNYNASGDNSVKVTVSSTDGTISPSVSLDSSDFKIVDSDGKDTTAIDATTNGTTPCDYRIVLTDAGIAKVQQALGNEYQVSQSTTGYGKLVINKAIGHLTLSGSYEASYGDNPPLWSKYGSSYTLTVDNAPGLTAAEKAKLKLKSGDIKFTLDGITTNFPRTEYGEYTVGLGNIVGRARGLNRNNIEWNNTSFASTATYTVVAAKVTATLSGTSSKTYDGSAVTADQLNATGSTVKVTLADTDDLSALADFTYQLKDGDYTWTTSDGKAPTDVGTYTLKLTTQGIANIQKQIDDNENIGEGHVTVTSTPDTAGTASFEIKKAVAHAVLSGSGSSTYTGQRVYPDTMGNGGVTLTVTSPRTNDNFTFFSHSITDYLDYSSDNGQTWTTSRPKDVGTYLIRVSADGIKAIKDNYGSDGNIVWEDNGASTITGQATWTVNAQTSDSSLANKGNYTKTYDGSTTSTIDTSKLGLTAMLNGKKTALDTTGLDSSSFEWVDKNGNAISVPVNVGTYYIKLTDAGFATLQTNNKNFNLTNNKGLAKYTITQAQASAILSGSGTRAYNGAGVSLDDLNKSDANNNITLTIKYPANGDASHSETIALTADDFVWNTPDGTAPVDANSQAYTLSLNKSAIEKLIEGKVGSGTDGNGQALSNVKFATDAISGTADYTITQSTTAAMISNNGDYGKTYDGSTTDTIDPSKLKLTAEVGGKAVDLTTTGMTGSDYEWVDADGNKLTSNPTNVGTYYIKLTSGGLTKLQSLEPNLTLTQTGLGKYVISAAQATRTLTGSGSKVYDGNAITLTNINQNGQIKVNLSFPGSNNASYTLKSTDYTISGNATDAGDYTITLTDTGKTNVENYIKSQVGTGQNGASNVEFATDAIGGSASFTIEKSANVASVSGTQTETYTGSAIGVDYNASGTNSVKVIFKSDNNGKELTSVDLASGDFEIVDADGNPTTAINAGGTYHIVLTADGVKKIQTAAGNNFTVTQNSNSYGTLVINKATGKASLSGSPTCSYTGTAVAPDGTNGYLGGYTITLDAPGNPTYTLKAGDVEFKVDGTWTTTAPVKVGTYEARLSSQGWTNVKKLNSDNVTWSATASPASTAKFIINEADVTASLGGSGSKVYNGSAVTLDDINGENSTIKVTFTGGNDITNFPTSYTLKQGDYEWVENSDPKDVGTYHLKLTDTGISNIQAQIDQAVGGSGLVKLSTTADQASFEITQAVAENVQLYGTEQSIYNGSPVSFDPTNAEVKNHFGFNNAQGLTIPEFTSSDFSWYSDADGQHPISAPTNAGTYYLLLNDDGKAALANANKNYSFMKDGKSTIAGSIAYTIDKANLTVSVSGKASKTYDGKNAAITQTDLDSGNIKIEWNGNETEPTDLSKLTLDPATDLEVVDASGNPVKDANANKNDATGNPAYKVQLTAAGWQKIKELTGSDNYNISDADTTGSYLIYTRRAQLTLSGSQSTTYGTSATLDPDKYTLKYSNWVDDPSKMPTKEQIGLTDGDLYIVYGNNTADGTSNVYPTDVGTYQVGITKQLLAKLKQLAPNYDFDGSEPTVGEPHSGSDPSHEPATYVITAAEATVTINGAQHVKYGQSTDIKDGQYTVTITAPVGNESSTILNQVALTKDDLTTVPADSNVGTYTIKLTAAGLARIQVLITGHGDVTKNYDWTQALEDSAQAKFFIDQMDVKIGVSGSQSVAYGSVDWEPAALQNGSPDVGKYDLTITTDDGKNLTYQLQSGDLVFSNTPKNVGKYEVKLSDQGLTNIKNKLGTNYSFPQAASDVTDHGAYTVTKGNVTVSFTGNGGRTYDGQSTIITSSTLNEASPKYSYDTGSVSIYDSTTGQTKTHVLAPEDLEIVPINGSTSNVGTYAVKLSQHGQEAIEALDGNNGGNYNWTFADSTATYKISQATATGILKGENGKTYDGSPVTTVELNSNGQILVHLTYPGSNDGSTYTLQKDDYVWATDGGQAPTNKGTYTIYLTTEGQSKLIDHLNAALKSQAGTGQNGEANVVAAANKLSGTAQFTISQQSLAGVTVSGNDQSKTYDGQGASLDVDGLTIKSGNTTLNKGTLSASDFDWYDGQGNKLDVAPINVGNYQAKLKDDAYQKLQAANPNYDITSANGTRLTMRLSKLLRQLRLAVTGHDITMAALLLSAMLLVPSAGHQVV